MSEVGRTVEHMFGGQMEGLHMEVQIREYDGVRSVTIATAPNLVFVEAGGKSYAIDRGIFLHGIKKALGLAFVVEEVVVVPL